MDSERNLTKWVCNIEITGSGYLNFLPNIQKLSLLSIYCTWYAAS